MPPVADVVESPPTVKPFLLTLDERSTDEVKDHWPNLILPKLKKDRDGLKWAWRSVNPDFTSSNGYRWPFPGHWAEAPGPFYGQHKGACPAGIGDGICLAWTISGATSSGMKLGSGLICAYRFEDILGTNDDGNHTTKFRVKRAWVGEVIGTIAELTHRGANLRHAYLSGADLSGADLRGANLRGANLRGANLRGANLSGADLSGADLRDADLSGADLSGADLSGADLRDADLRGANLWGANLRDAYLSGADLWGANLRGADLRDADLSDAYLSDADLRDADLSDAYLSGADLSDADNVTYSHLAGARYSQLTLWPAGFDPKAAGAVLV